MLPFETPPLVFEPGSCTRVGGHIWQDGKAPSLRANAGDNQPAIALEHHPHDSRINIADTDIVQTLNARMGTGGQCATHYVHYRRVINCLCARDYKGPESRYVQAGKLIVQHL